MAVPALTSPPLRTPTRPNIQQTISNVVLGNLRFAPEYPSCYPEELVNGHQKEWLCVCQWCFRYTSEVVSYAAHYKVCPLRDEAPPGELIYEKDGYAIHRVDGEEHKLYAQNLSLFAKLFLDTKSVFFDVSSFLYYTLVSRRENEDRNRVIGFFSKEKMSWDNNNLACILVFPPWQRQGLGQILMGASYVLGRREGRFGGPEKPLSVKGKAAYVRFWQGEIMRFVLGVKGKGVVSLKSVSEGAWILGEDVVVALREMGVAEGRKTASGNVVVSKAKVKAWAERHGVSFEPPVDVDAFVVEEVRRRHDGSDSQEVSSLEDAGSHESGDEEDE